MNDQARWYALSVYARQEKAAAKEIESFGYEAFLPLTSERRLWSDRIKRIETALFPGYLFVHVAMDAATRIRLIRPKQVIDVVGKKQIWQAGALSYIPDEKIASLRIFSQSKQQLEPLSHLVKGAEVQVIQGPLKGAMGIIQDEPDGKQRIVVQVPLLGRGVRAVLSAEDVLSYTELPERYRAA